VGHVRHGQYQALPTSRCRSIVLQAHHMMYIWPGRTAADTEGHLQEAAATAAAADATTSQWTCRQQTAGNQTKAAAAGAPA
jgi:hypothetical protein